MHINKKFNRLLLFSSILFSLSYSGSINTVFAHECSQSENIVNPMLNYVSLYIPEEQLNEVTPSGHSVAYVLTKSLSEYKKGVTPFYIDDVLIVNKEFGLPSTLTSTPLTDEAKNKFNEMASDALKEGIHLRAFSTFRSYERQVQLYSNYVARDGQEAADRYSARPGFSEHQTTLAYDIGGLDSSLWASFSFYKTKEAEWLAENAHKYGFVLRYPDGKEDVTGYRYESWHFRYVGEKMSNRIHESGVSIEEFFGLDKVKQVKELLPTL